MLVIDDQIAYEQYKEYLNSSPDIISVKDNIITTKDYVVEVYDQYLDILELVTTNDIIENSGYKFKTY